MKVPPDSLGLARRLSRMSASELGARLGQEINKRVDAARALLGLPPRGARLGAHAPGEFFFSAEDIPSIVETVKSRLPAEVDAVLARADSVCAGRFDLLGYEGLDYGAEPDWRLDLVSGKSSPLIRWYKLAYLDFNKVGDHKLVWELSRHQALTGLVRAWLYSGRAKYLERAERLWRSWRRGNPYPRGVNWASSLEVAFRALSWLWMERMLAAGERPEERAPWRGELATGVAASAGHIERYLSTYFSPNTHLLGEAAALFIIGHSCRQFRASERWRALGRETLAGELARQIRPDGMHFEQSLYYHVYALDMLLHCLVVAEKNSEPLGAEFDDALVRMARTLASLSQGGAAPRFGDDDGGRLFDPRRNRGEHLLDPLAGVALLFARADLKVSADPPEETLWLFGASAAKKFDSLESGAAAPLSRCHPDCGYHVMVSSTEGPRQAAILDAGPLGALRGGHGHADALSLQLIRGGRHWLSDPGAYCYPAQRPERDRFRSTPVHNTLSVDEQSQAEPDGPFAWQSLPRARTLRWVAGEWLDLFVGEHDGYRRLSGEPVHRRWVVGFKSGLLVVRDLALGSGKHKLDLVWGLGPGFRVAQLTADAVEFAGPAGGSLSFVAPRSAVWRREIFDAEWSPAYGARQSAPAVQYSAETLLPVEYAAAIVPRQDAVEGARSLTRLPAGAGRGLSVYEFRDRETTTRLWFSEDGAAWSFGGWASDAAFLCSERRGDRIINLFLAAGSRLEIDGEEILKTSRQLESWEARREDSGWRTEGPKLNSAAARALGKARFDP